MNIRIYLLLLVQFSISGIAQITTFPYQEDFESGAGGWAAESANEWILGTPNKTFDVDQARSGSNAWVTGPNLNADYPNDAIYTLISEEINFGSTDPSLFLFECFMLYRTEENYDGVKIFIDQNNNAQLDGSDIEVISNLYSEGTNFDGIQGRSDGIYSSCKFFFPSNSNNNIRVIFQFTSIDNIEDDGFAIDDVSITKRTIQTATLPYSNNFDAGTNDWTNVFGGNEWILGSPNKTDITGTFSGSNSWYTGPNATSNYIENATWLLETPQFTFPDKSTQAYKMQFRMDYDISDAGTADYLQLKAITSGNGEIIIDEPGAVNWYTIAQGWSGDRNLNDDGYLLMVTNLPDEVYGQDVRFQFLFKSDDAFNSADGASIDNFELYAINPPTDIQLSNNTIEERRPVGTDIGTFTATDADANESFTFAITGGPDASSFSMNNDILEVNQVLGEGTYTIEITVTDKDGLTYSEDFVITYSPNKVSIFPYSEDFDGGMSKVWFDANANTNEWILGTPSKPTIDAANSPANAWVTGPSLSVNYEDDASYELLSPVIENDGSIDADFKLSFQTHFITETAYDGMKLFIDVNLDGAVDGGDIELTNLNLYSTERDVITVIGGAEIVNGEFTGVQGNSGGYQLAEVMMPASVPSEFRFIFQFLSEASNNDEGVAIDDVVFENTVITVESDWDNESGDNIWNTASNWTTDALPTANDDRILDHVHVSGAYDVLIQSDAFVDNLTIQNADITVVVQTGATLHYTTIEGAGTLIVEDGGSLLPNDLSDPANSGAIDNNGTLTTIIRRTKQTPGVNYYSFMSSPVVNYSVSELKNDGANNILGLTPGTNLDPQFHFKPVSGILEQGVGYAINGNFTADFTGIPHNGDIISPIAVFEEAGAKGALNFLGNPYPSAISIIDFLDENSGVLENGAIYLAEVSKPDFENPEDDRTNNIVIVNGTGASSDGYVGKEVIDDYKLPTAQAFQVVANIASGTSNQVLFTNEMRVAGENSDFRDGNSQIALQEAEFIWIESEQATIESSTLIAFGAQASDQKDFWYDAKKVGGLKGLDIASVTDEEQFGINTFSNETDSLFIPLRLRFPSAGQAKLKIASMKDIRVDRQVYLYDMQRNTYQELSKGGDSLEFFVPQAGYQQDRFAIVSLLETSKNPTANFHIEENKTFAYGATQLIVIESEFAGNATVFNLQGQMINQSDIQVGNHTIDIASGAYLVQFVSDDHSVVKTQKVIVR